MVHFVAPRIRPTSNRSVPGRPNWKRAHSQPPQPHPQAEQHQHPPSALVMFAPMRPSMIMPTPSHPLPLRPRRNYAAIPPLSSCDPSVLPCFAPTGYKACPSAPSFGAPRDARRADPLVSSTWSPWGSPDLSAAISSFLSYDVRPQINVVSSRAASIAYGGPAIANPLAAAAVPGRDEAPKSTGPVLAAPVKVTVSTQTHIEDDETDFEPSVDFEPINFVADSPRVEAAAARATSPAPGAAPSVAPVTPNRLRARPGLSVQVTFDDVSLGEPITSRDAYDDAAFSTPIGMSPMESVVSPMESLVTCSTAPSSPSPSLASTCSDSACSSPASSAFEVELPLTPASACSSPSTPIRRKIVLAAVVPKNGQSPRGPKMVYVPKGSVVSREAVDMSAGSDSKSGKRSKGATLVRRVWVPSCSVRSPTSAASQA